MFAHLFKKEKKSAWYIVLILSILITNAAGILGALFTTPNIPTWYAGVSKPALNPPNWIFGPVWTLLFVLMGIALFLVWHTVTYSSSKRNALLLFGTQLFYNMLWSVTFFGMQNPLAGFIVILVLWGFILATILSFYRLNKTAAYLLIPYILWVTFAGYLNASIWLLNM